MRRATWVLAFLLLAPAAVLAQEPSGGIVEHRVQPGETLWSISRTYFGDPFAWRQILEANQDRIENPQWIEPGLVLKIPVTTTTSAPLAEAAASSSSTTAEIQGVQVTTVPRRFGTPVRPVAESPYGDRTVFYTAGGGQRASSGPVTTSVSRMRDSAVLLSAVPRDVFYTAGWLIPVDTEPEAVGWIADFAAGDRGRIFDRKTAYPFDRVRIELDGGLLAAVGDQLMTFRLGREIENIGQVVLPTGIVTVTKVESGGVIAVLADEYGRVDLGDAVSLLPPYPLVPGESALPATSDQVGHILTFQDAHLLQSLGSIAYLDLGSADGVGVGDEFVVYASEGRGSEGEPIGRLQVVGSYADHSAARIIDLTAPLFVQGLEVRLVAKMP